MIFIGWVFLNPKILNPKCSDTWNLKYLGVRNVHWFTFKFWAYYLQAWSALIFSKFVNLSELIGSNEQDNTYLKKLLIKYLGRKPMPNNVQ